MTSQGTSRVRRHQRRATIYDVAKRARASVFSVSAVINRRAGVSPALRRRVEAAIQLLNYRPNLVARSLTRRTTQTLAVLVPDIANPFYPLVVRGAEDTAQEAGYSVLLCNSEDKIEKEELYLETLLAKRVDGILLTKTPQRFTASCRRILAESNIPIVLLMRSHAELNADVVLTDDAKGAYELVSHLIRVGHRSFGFVTGPLSVSNAKARWLGIRKALKENGLGHDPSLVFEGDYRVESGYRAGLTLLLKKLDAVFVANYLMTVGFMNAAEEMGIRCPEDIALGTFDDYPWLGCFHPRLTTVELPKYELGQTAVRLLLDRIANPGKRRSTVKLAPVLRVRDSCGFQLARGIRPPATNVGLEDGGLGRLNHASQASAPATSALCEESGGQVARTRNADN